MIIFDITCISNHPLFRRVQKNGRLFIAVYFQRRERFGRMVEVVDAPGYFDASVTDNDTNLELYRALMLTVPGFHAIGLVLQTARFTKELKQLVDEIFNFFEHSIGKHAFIIFTHVQTQTALLEYLGMAGTCNNNSNVGKHEDWRTDPLLKWQIKEHSGSLDHKLKELIDRFEGNIMIIDNDEENANRDDQAKAILEEVERIKRSTNNACFRNSMFEAIDKIVQEDQQKFLQKKETRKFFDWLKQVSGRPCTTDYSDYDGLSNASPCVEYEEQQGQCANSTYQACTEDVHKNESMNESAADISACTDDTNDNGEHKEEETTEGDQEKKPDQERKTAPAEVINVDIDELYQLLKEAVLNDSTLVSVLAHKVRAKKPRKLRMGKPASKRRTLTGGSSLMKETNA